METPKELAETLPLLDSHKNKITLWRSELYNIISGQAQKRLLIVGPCSIHDEDEALKYAQRLKKLSLEVEDSLFIIMRAFVEKSRTFLGWKGFARAPEHNGTEDVSKGIFRSRKLLIDLVNLGLPIAMEFVNPLLSCYFSDLITYGVIGARTVHSQTHRELASLLPMPIGFKNSLSGNVLAAIQGAAFAKKGHMFPHIDHEGNLTIVKSAGNICPHVILRGASTHENFDIHHVTKTEEQLIKHSLFPFVIIDAAHGNSKNDLQKQKEIVHYIANFNRPIGIMFESYISEGAEPNCQKSNYSVTDPCLDWETTETLVYTMGMRSLCV